MLEYIKGELLDHALFLGMSVDEYWFADPTLLENYEKAFDLKQEYDKGIAWLNGAYVQSALNSSVVWAVLPAKASEYKNRPEYANFPIKERPVKKEYSQEKKELIEKTRNRLAMLGLLEKK